MRFGLSEVYGDLVVDQYLRGRASDRIPADVLAVPYSLRTDASIDDARRDSSLLSFNISHTKMIRCLGGIDKNAQNSKRPLKQRKMYTVNTAAADVEAVFRLDGKVQRFSDLERQVYRISRKMLAQQLRSIERVGLILRTDYDEVSLFFRWMRLEQNRT